MSEELLVEDEKLAGTIPGVLLVEDQKLASDEMAISLKLRGVVVVQAGNAAEAIRKARSTEAKVVLMDIELGADSQNGIEAAQQILRINPYCSIIFVTAFEPHYRQEAVRLKLRVAGWIPKPIVNYLDILVKLIGKELKKSDLRRSLHTGVDQNLPLGEHLQLFLESSRTISPEVVGELVDELVAEEAVDLDGGIRLLYAALEHFVGRLATEPGLRERTETLHLRLESLEEREADELEERFRERFRVQPAEIDDAYARARRLLES